MSVKKRITEGIDSFAIIHFSPAAGIRADHLATLDATRKAVTVYGGSSMALSHPGRLDMYGPSNNPR
jgi:hypothetical protein